MSSDFAPLPRPPDRPHPQECCGRGCCPCIMDYYDDALARWEARIRERGLDPQVVLQTFASASLAP